MYEHDKKTENEARRTGTGPEGTIPVSDEGIALTTTTQETNFNQEEDAAGAELPPGCPAGEVGHQHGT